MTPLETIRMTSKSTKKDYKAMYLAQKKEADLLGKSLKQATQVVNEMLTKLKEKDEQLAKYIIKDEKFADFRGVDINDILDGYEASYKEGLSDHRELKKYKEAEKAYNLKFGLEETRLTSQEMKEMERRAREEEDEDDDRPLVSKPKKSKPKKK